MKSLFTLLLFVLGISITGFSSPWGFSIDGKDTISIKSDFQTTVCDLAIIESVKLELSDYVYFIPIKGDSLDIIIKQNQLLDNQPNKTYARYLVRERKKWVTRKTLNSRL